MYFTNRDWSQLVVKTFVKNIWKIFHADFASSGNTQL